MSRKRRLLKIFLLLVLLAVVIIQFVPVDRDNPAITQDIPAPTEVKAILRRSCYDCHSNETKWPWYGYVAPVSWLVADDVRVARTHMNFSEWDQYDAGDRTHLLEEIWEEVEHGEMPLENYLFLHGDAELSDADRETLRVWTGEADGGHEEGDDVEERDEDGENDGHDHDEDH